MRLLIWLNLILLTLFLLTSNTLAETIFVTNSASSGPGTLNEAVAFSNTATGVQTVEINISSPILQTSTISINQPIIINGHHNTITSTGCTILSLNPGSDDSQIHDLIITDADSYQSVAIQIQSDNNTITGCVIGTDWQNSTAKGNYYGIYLYNAHNNLIGGTRENGNIVSGNSYYGIYLNHSNNNIVVGNTCGLAPNMSAEIANTIYGIYLYYSDNNHIGIPINNYHNIFSGNGTTGIYIGNGSEYNLVQNNRVGLINSNTASTSQDYGIQLSGHYNLIGYNELIGKNNIAGNTHYDIYISGNGNTVIGNYIGTDLSGQTAIITSKSAALYLYGDYNIIGYPEGGMSNLIVGGNDAIYISSSGGDNACAGNTISGYSDKAIEIYYNYSKPTIQYANTDRVSGRYGEYYWYYPNTYIEIYKKYNNNLEFLGFSYTDNTGNYSIAVSGLQEGDYVCALGISSNKTTLGFSNPVLVDNSIRAPTPTPTPDYTVPTGKVKIFNNVLYRNNVCTIRWQQPYDSPTTIRVVDENGHVKMKLIDQVHYNKNILHQLSWNGCDHHNQFMASGLYYIHIQSKDMNNFSKIMIINQ